jgi:uncharacterized membrane protein
MAIYNSRTTTNSNATALEIDHMNTHALISWRAVVAGLLVTLFAMTGLIGLGLAIGGINMDADTTAKSAGLFSGIWFLASAIISLFAGSYFAARVSKFRTSRIGSAQGLVIASLFLGLFLWQTMSVIGAAGGAVGSMLGKTGEAVASGAQKAGSSPAVTSAVSNITENALGDLNLKSDPGTVAQGVGTRLIRGDADGAKNYLAYQSGISPTEADRRIAEMKVKVDKAVDDAKIAAGTALKSTGWTLFSLVVLGALAAVGGGAVGSMANFKKPLIIEDTAFSPRHA